MIQTPICDLLGIQYPVLQGGMAWIADAELAAAVSNAGGLGNYFCYECRWRLGTGTDWQKQNR